jgi:hypothetical protein
MTDASGATGLNRAAGATKGLVQIRDKNDRKRFLHGHNVVAT